MNSPSCPDLASQPTLSRLENRVSRTQLRRVGDELLEAYLAAHSGHRDLIVLDIDSTGDPTHGHQQMSMFHGFYDQHMFHPLLAFGGVSGYPIAAVLRAANAHAHASKGAAAILKRILPRLQRAYPAATILVRAGAGFAVPSSLYKLLEEQGVR